MNNIRTQSVCGSVVPQTKWQVAACAPSAFVFWAVCVSSSPPSALVVLSRCEQLSYRPASGTRRLSRHWSRPASPLPSSFCGAPSPSASRALWLTPLVGSPAGAVGVRRSDERLGRSMNRSSGHHSVERPLSKTTFTMFGDLKPGFSKSVGPPKLPWKTLMRLRTNRGPISTKDASSSMIWRKMFFCFVFLNLQQKALLSSWSKFTKTKETLPGSF